MASLISNLSSTVSRLTLLRKPPVHLSTKTLKTLQPHPKLSRPLLRFLRHTTDFVSVHYSSCPKAQATKVSIQEEELVVLGIETSCDDTAAAVVRGNGEILSQVVSSQAELLVRYGGVAPKMAEEAHSLVVQEALDRAKLTAEDLSAVAMPSLSWRLEQVACVGVRKARKVAGSYCLPIIGIHHMEAHALVARLVERELQFPFMALLISGGHNLIVLARDLGHYIQLGTTIDDAIGEAYDKTAKWLGLDMRKSGGPAVEQLAREGDENSIKFKVPMKHHKDCNFSYAGLKTQVELGWKNLLSSEQRRLLASLEELIFELLNDSAIPVASTIEEDRRARADIAASFQRVAVLHLEEKCDRAIEWGLKIEPSMKYLVVSGGVASNQYVRSRLNKIVEKKGLQLVCPPPSLCTDNGVMIAWTGIEHFQMGRYNPPPPAYEPEDAAVDLRPRWSLGEELEEGRSGARSVRKAWRTGNGVRILIRCTVPLYFRTLNLSFRIFSSRQRFPTDSSSNPMSQFTDEDSENPRSLAPKDIVLLLPLRALKNQSSDLGDTLSTRSCSMLLDDWGNKKRRMRPGFVPPPPPPLAAELRRSYSTMFSRSSSVVTKIKESKSSEGSWHLRENVDRTVKKNE